MVKKVRKHQIDYYARIIKFFLIINAALLAFTTHANAASTSWQDLGGGKARLVANLDPVNNKVSGVIEVLLEKGWSTYWRYPGSSGIPPRFDFSKSKAVNVGEVQFPTPKLVTQDYGSYAGYKDKVLFPFEAEVLATSGSLIHLDLFIGVCEKVCIPAQAEMTMDTNKLLQSDPQAVQVVSFAKLAIPKKADADNILLDVKRADKNTLMIKTRHKKSFGTPSLFVEGPYNWYLTPAELVSQEDDTASFKLDISRAPKDADILSEKLTYTLATGTKGIEIQR